MSPGGIEPPALRAETAQVHGLGENTIVLYEDVYSPILGLGK